jgi:hypothetical protein
MTNDRLEDRLERVVKPIGFLSSVICYLSFSLVQTPASGWEEPSWFPLQKEDDCYQDHDFAEHRRAQYLLKDLVRTPDPKR